MIGIPASLRRINQQAVLRHLLAHGQASRAQIAKAIGLSAPTVGKVVVDLLASQIIEEIPADDFSEALSPGRPGRLLQIDQTTPRLIVLQLGVRHTRLNALPIAGPVDESWPVEFATPQTPAAFRKLLANAAKKLPASEPWAVMISIPGAVDEQAGKVLLSPNLHWLEKADLASIIAQVWDAPVRFVQEIRALAMGQLQTGPQEDFFLMDIGEGVGGAAVIGGKLFSATLPLTGELGHTPIDQNTRPCGCGGVGCLETLLSRGGLIQTLTTGRQKADWVSVVRRVEQSGVEPALARTLDAAARVLAGTMNVMGVRRVVVTGALSDLPESVMTYLSDKVAQGAMWGKFGRVECIAAPRRRAAGLVAMAVQQLLLSSDASASRGSASS